jgi:hypothetical protein
MERAMTYRIVNSQTWFEVKCSKSMRVIETRLYRAEAQALASQQRRAGKRVFVVPCREVA